MTIRDAIFEIMKKEFPPLSMACTVLSVDEDKSVCDVLPLDDSAQIFDVLLLAEQANDKGVVMIPVVGSVVYVTFISKDLAFVSLIAEVSKVSIQIKDISLIIDEGQISLNGENLGGIVDAGELKTQIDKNTALLEAIKTAFINWVVVPTDGGTALKVLSAQFITKSTANLSSIENKTVKHGN